MIYVSIHGFSFITITYLIKSEIYFGLSFPVFVPKSRMDQSWIISVNLDFVRYVNTNDSINRASTAF